MKQLLLIIYLFVFIDSLYAQGIAKGKIVVEKFLASSVQGNSGGEEPIRQVTIYLPAGYDDSKQRYPVLYFLHGFTVDDSFYMSTYRLDELLDEAIASDHLRPMILVLPNSDTKFKGSFYTNTQVNGKWADYISRDVVAFIDKKFRTIPNKNSRGLAGHSMGGNGAIKIGMANSHVFGAVYALSPARLDWGAELTINSPGFKKVQLAKNEEEIFKDFFAHEITAIARAYSPNKQKPPTFVDLPFEYQGDSVLVNVDTYKKWNENFPINMIDDHIASLKTLNALKLDWGRNEQFSFIPVACLNFSKKLEAFGIDHFAEEYIGDHDNKLGGIDGRIYTEVFPFFDFYLKFETKDNMPTKKR